MSRNQPQFTAEELKTRYECARLTYEYQFDKEHWTVEDGNALFDWAVFGKSPFSKGKKERFLDEEVDLRLRCFELAAKFRNRMYGENIVVPADQLYYWIMTGKDCVKMESLT